MHKKKQISKRCRNSGHLQLKISCPNPIKIISVTFCSTKLIVYKYFHNLIFLLSTQVTSINLNTMWIQYARFVVVVVVNWKYFIHCSSWYSVHKRSTYSIINEKSSESLIMKSNSNDTIHIYLAVAEVHHSIYICLLFCSRNRICRHDVILNENGVFVRLNKT